ncbi:Protein phosphatase 4 core regulatory subunit R2 [Sesbania bispinosa]|nr:Protein phosphatase 4 core regulatory subunit R2 [Sesbania bispinosa]
METQSHENLQHAPVSSNDTDNLQNDAVPDASNHRDTEQKRDVSSEQVIQILQVIASTGKFWHDWDNLKSMLSFQLKQVLSEYPEAKMASEQQYASLGEPYSELVNKLDEALTCFIDGPPFTLQRLCEILLDPRSIYPNLSKLALALEKNLLVTSTLTICTDPYPQATVQEPDDQEKTSEKQQQQSDSAQNGIEPLEADKDEVMAEADMGDDMTIDMENFEDVKSSETNSEPSANNA